MLRFAILALTFAFLPHSQCELVTSTSSPDVCNSLVDPGPCRNFQTQWHWNRDRQRCTKFQYGGCSGNGNRFGTRKACKAACQRRRGRRPTSAAVGTVKAAGCLEPKDRGFCREESRGTWWWYFDVPARSCRQFWFSGCGGNGNRFYSKFDCQNACVDLGTPSAYACDKCNRETSFCLRQMGRRDFVRCKCKPGYIKNSRNECIDVDECRNGAAECDVNAYCDNTVGSYHCTCFKGFLGNGRLCKYLHSESPVSDCSRCDVNAGCESGRCVCRAGFRGDGERCTDVNECVSTGAACSLQARCENVPGSFVCACKSGYAGDGHTCTPEPDACNDELDAAYKGSCRLTDWRQKFFWDASVSGCRGFWWDGCRGASRNFFSDVQTCTSLCKRTAPRPVPPRTSAMCLEHFDGSLRAQCGPGNWRKRFYFDVAKAKCRMFWYDGCASGTRNLFHDRSSCRLVCESVHGGSIGTNRILGANVAEFRSNPPAAVAPAPSAVYYVAAHHQTVAAPTIVTLEDQRRGIAEPPLFMPLRVKASLKGSRPPPTLAFLGTGSPGSSYSIGKISASFAPASEHGVGGFVDVYEDIPDTRKRRRPVGYVDATFDDDAARPAQKGDRGVVGYVDVYEDTPEARKQRGLVGYVDAAFEDEQPTEWKIKAVLSPQLLGDSNSANWPQADQPPTLSGPTKTKTAAHSSSDCVQPFDPRLEAACHGGANFSLRFRFDTQAGRCVGFWWNGCRSPSPNNFESKLSCRKLCDNSFKQRTPTTTQSPAKIPSRLNPCEVPFDEQLRLHCNGVGNWTRRWFFDKKQGNCDGFWWQGCPNKTANFFLNEDACRDACQLNISSRLAASSPLSRRCVLPVNRGNCTGDRPAFFFHRFEGRCKPFSYSGCHGNANRFRSAADCHSECGRMTEFQGHSGSCFHPLSVGYGRQTSDCTRKSGNYYFFEAKTRACTKFWYFGCGGNSNRFQTAAECAAMCSKIPPKDVGACPFLDDAEPRTRWHYDGSSRKCRSFQYSGCGGNGNRFGTLRDCERSCGGLHEPASERCSAWADWGSCNSLRWRWAWNLTSGRCEGFLWGGCEGNGNRFDSAAACNAECRPLDRDDPCREKLDRGRWCARMVSAYYFDPSEGRCRGFHYTGCGRSRNRFTTQTECEESCVVARRTRRRPVEGRPLREAAGEEDEEEEEVEGGPQKPNPPMQRARTLADVQARNYMKTQPLWVPYSKCIGFRYNVSGPGTRLETWLCRMESGGGCRGWEFGSTGGGEECGNLRPWTTGTHLYSWFFNLKGTSSAEATLATILPLGLNNCWDAC